MQEEPHPPGRLVPDRGGLLRAVRPGQQQAGRGARRPDHHPPLGPSVVRLGGGVLHQLEAERADEELDGRVILGDDEGDEAQVHRVSIGRQRQPGWHEPGRSPRDPG